MFGKKRNAEAKGQVPKAVPKDGKSRVRRDRWKQFMDNNGTLESELLYEMSESRSLAWSVAKVAAAFTVIAWIGVGFVLYRYSQPIPAQLMTMNPETGMYQVTELKESQVSYGEATDSGYIAEYIINRMSYNYYQQQTFFDETVLASSNNVASPYIAQFGGENGKDVRWGDRRFTDVEVISVTPLGEGRATVRYSTQTRFRNKQFPEPREYWTATLSYEYPNRVMTVEERLMNPLGFMVTAFSNHEENASGR